MDCPLKRLITAERDGYIEERDGYIEERNGYIEERNGYIELSNLSAAAHNQRRRDLLMKFMCSLIVLCASLNFGASTALAKPQHKESLGRRYSTYLDASLKRCATCHVVPG